MTENEPEVPSHKTCSACAETVKFTANKCKHCGEDLSVKEPPKKAGAVTGTVVGALTGWGVGALVGIVVGLLGAVLCYFGLALIGIPFILVGIASPFVGVAGGGAIGLGVGITDEQKAKLEQHGQRAKESSFNGNVDLEKNLTSLQKKRIMIAIGITIAGCLAYVASAAL